MAVNTIQLIENLNEIELKEFLRNNDMSDCLCILDLEALNGETFWNLSKTDFRRWQNHFSLTKLRKLRKFWKDMKENPDKLVLPSIKTATIQNASPFLQELEEDEQTKHCTDNQVTKSSLNESSNSESTHQEENNGSRHKETQGKKAHMQNNQNIDSKYYLHMNRCEAETFLKALSKNGDYLFRPSTKHFCALSVFFGNDVLHIPIKSVGGKKLRLAVNGYPPFNSLDDIVKHFEKHPIMSFSQKVIKLGDPIYK